MYELFFTKTFDKKLKRIIKNNRALGKRVSEKLEILVDNPSHSSLRLHKLGGRNNWSISVNRNIRILITIRGDIILCTDIGTHDEVY